MIKSNNIYEVVAALVPLYFTLILAYCSIRWWKIFTPEQCSGINRFVAVFAIPFLSFHFISSNNPYTMNFRFLAADSLQKVVILVALFLWNTFTKWGSINWTITLFSLSTLPNTLIMGIPLLKTMYGDFTQSLMVQIVVLQCVIWYTLLLFMFEYRGAKLLISEQFPDNAGAIASVRVDSNISSLCGTDSLQVDAEIGENGAFHVVVRSMSRSMSIASSLLKSYSTPRSSNLNNVSSREPRQKASSFSGINLYPSSLQSASFEEVGLKMHEERIRRSKSVSEGVFNSGLVSSNISLKSMLPRPNSSDQRDKYTNGSNATNKDLSSSSNNVIVEYTGYRIGTSDHGTIGSSKTLDLPQDTAASKVLHELEIEQGVKHPVLRKEMKNEEDDAHKKQQMPRARVMIRLILIMVWRNLVRNPNSYASVLGIIWSLISFRWNINMPSIVKDSISILSNTGLGMAMFSLGLFSALQPKIINCGKIRATISMAIKFLVGPAVIAATSKAMNIHGVFLKIAIVQAALPQGIVPFVFAKEYNLHADMLSTAVIFGMLVALPVTIIYYMLLGL